MNQLEEHKVVDQPARPSPPALRRREKGEGRGESYWKRRGLLANNGSADGPSPPTPLPKARGGIIGNGAIC